jgi:hypothetical protein
MLMDSSHLSNQPLIVRVLRRTRDRTNKIREVVMLIMKMMSDGYHDDDNGHDGHY